MKILSITLVNFRQYYGENTIKFAADKSHNLTVIHGLNGAGKTALLNSFAWGLYGSHKLPTAEPDYSRRAFAELQEGGSLEIKVCIVFEHEGSCYEVRRSRTVSKKNGKEFWHSAQTNLSLTVKDVSGKTEVVNNPGDRISQILPQEMQPYFFFDGEDINRLGDTKNADYTEKIKKAIKNLMDISVVEHSIQHVDKVHRIFRKGVAGHGDSSVQEFSQKIEEADQKIQELKDQIAEQKREKSHLQIEIDDITERLTAIKPVKDLQNRRNDLERQREIKKGELARLEKECREIIQRDAALPYLQNAALQVAELIEAKRKKGVLPSGIRETFIQDILERGICICGREFHDGDEACNAIKELLDRQTGNAAIEDGIQLLTAHLSRLDDSCSDLQTFLSRFVDTRRDINKFFVETNNLLSEISAEIEKVAPKDGSENPAELERKKREKDSERDNLTSSIAVAENNLKMWEGRKKIYEDKLTMASKQDEKCQLATRRMEAAKNVGLALLKLNEILVTKVKDSVSDEIKHMLAAVTDSYLDGEVTPDFELKTYKRDNGMLVPIATSTGQQQVTSLAFIASLVKIAKKNMENKASNFLRGGEFPIVMDAPFNNVDSIYGPRIAEFLPQSTPQVILMTNPQQWHGLIEEVLRPFVGSEYIIVKNSNVVEQAASVTLPAGVKELNKQVDGIQYSVIEEA